METKYITKRQLQSIPCRFILGLIGQSRELSLEANTDLVRSIEQEFGTVEEIFPTEDFPNPPASYSVEMGNDPFSTSIIILKDGGAYTDLHHLKKKTVRLEEQLRNSQGERSININPGTVGTAGVYLASHKPTGERRDIGVYAYGFVPQLFFGGKPTYQEKIMNWTGERLELTEDALTYGKFPEYSESGRLDKLEAVVRTLPKNNRSFALITEKEHHPSA